jgi:hypothetical protein
VLTPTGNHARPPGPTRIDDIPLISVVIVLVLMSVINGLSVVGVYEISVVLEPSDAISVMTSFVGVGTGVIELGGLVVDVGKTGVGVGLGVGPFVVMAVLDGIELDDQVVENTPGRNVMIIPSVVKVAGPVRIEGIKIVCDPITKMPDPKVRVVSP